jgi:hypothetical protein
MEGLRRTGKTIIISGNSTLGHEVHQSFQWDGNESKKALKRVLTAMDGEERRFMRQDWDNNKGENFGQKWEQRCLELERFERFN